MSEETVVESPTPAEALEEGLAHHGAGRLEEADAAYRRVLAARPDHPDALHLLGVMAHQAGNDDSALELIGKAIRNNPSNAVYHNNIGEVYRTVGRLDEAAAAYRRVLDLKPDYADGHNSLGAVLQLQGKLNEALAAYRDAVSLEPGHALAHYNIGIVFQEQGKLDEAVAAYRRAVAVKPDYADAHYNMGVALNAQGKPEEAVAAHHRLLELKPDHPEGHNNLGEALRAQGKLAEAMVAYRRALALKPNYGEAHNNLAVALQGQGRLDEAIAAYRRAIADFPRAHGNLLLCLHYQPGQDPATIFAEHRRWAERHAGPLSAAIRPHRNNRDPDRRLRIGYISPDFRTHSVAYFFETLLAAHDAAQVEVVCYADVPRPDGTTARLRGLAGSWRDIYGMSDEEVADQVRRDGIDIFVDLAGHTANNRMMVFARKPAPVQVSYIGYCDTTGLDTMDYRLTDGLADPEGQDALYSEELIRLPRCFLCYTPVPEAPPIGPLPARGAGHVTFGSFNNLAKVTLEVVALWSRILAAVPDARLLLKASSLNDAATRDRYIALFEDQGIARERIDLVGQIPATIDHLALYGNVDIGLDTFSYNGTATTCEALWMGVPVVTLAGRAHPGRVGVSLLSAVGLEELIAEDPGEYVAIAARLAGDLDRLSALRAGLRSRMRASPLCHRSAHVRAVEGAWRAMWRRWCGQVQASSNGRV